MSISGVVVVSVAIVVDGVDSVVVVGVGVVIVGLTVSISGGDTVVNGPDICTRKLCMCSSSNAPVTNLS